MEQRIIVLASTNKHKIKEITKMLAENPKTANVKLISLAEVGFLDDIEETGLTFFENALIKAKAVHEFLESNNLTYDVLSDDSGLCIDALNGAPGVFSARYAGEHGNDEKNRNKVLSELNGEQNRNAQFETVVVLMRGNGEYISAKGETKGEILTEPHGSLEFCYDPIFYSCDLKKCFGECTESEKNSVSHRGRAIQNLIELM